MSLWNFIKNTKDKKNPKYECSKLYLLKIFSDKAKNFKKKIANHTLKNFF